MSSGCKKYQNAHLEWWRKHETMFLVVDILLRQILEIVGFQVETKNFFILAVIIVNLKCCLQLGSLKFLFVLSRN
jgi:hypothetical protein